MVVVVVVVAALVGVVEDVVVVVVVLYGTSYDPQITAHAALHTLWLSAYPFP